MDENTLNQNTPASGDADSNVNQVDENQNGEQGDLAERSKGRGVQDRIDELTGEIYTLKRELDEAKKKPAAPPPPPLEPNVQKAREYLKGLGFMTAEEMEQKLSGATQDMKNRMELDSEHMRLTGAYDGADGRPQYNKSKVETFMRDHAVYDPEVAYKALHEAELLDWQLKKAGTTKSKPYVERGGSSSRNAQEDNTITREKIDEWMKTPEGRLKYEQNRGKILDMLTKGQL